MEGDFTKLDIHGQIVKTERKESVSIQIMQQISHKV